MEINLTDKVLIVTGAASGIGKAVARLSALAGARLVLADRNGEGCRAVGHQLVECGAQVETVETELRDVGAVRSISAAALRRFGRIDGLVNAAGLTTRASFRDGSPEVWDDLFAVNARAPFFLMQETIADMASRGAPGSIVNILSMNAHCGAPELAIYSATKGALMTLTKNAANAHMSERIRINGINLGWVATEAEHRTQSETLGLGPGWIEAAAARMPLGRLVEAEEAARVAVFLLSDASIPMCGAVIDLEQWVVGAPG